MRLYLLILFIASLTMSCHFDSGKKEEWKAEIIQVEKEFSDMAQKDGIGNAFAKYSSEDVILMRNNTLVKGKEGLLGYYEKTMDNTEAQLSWKPEFVDVSESGDMGYTYGYYTFVVKDSTGKDLITKGVFHTIWKKQEDGTWKFVWD